MTDINGKIIGQYQLVEVIGQNASAVVCKAFQASANRYVAVRFLKPEIAHQPQDVQRFLQTGELLARLHHPRLLEVYENGQAEGLNFRAERLAENGSLQDRLVFGPLNPFYEINRVINLFQEIVEGLDFIYAQGYTHGNLKPANILLDSMMHPLLIDFGLPTKPEAVTSPYTAPEQLIGGAVDRRADVYALGVLLYTTLVGLAPQAGIAANPRTSRPDLPLGVESVIFKAMDQNPNLRYQSTAEFMNALLMALITPAPAQPVYASLPVAPAAGVSQTVNVAAPKKGTNWIAIILGGLLVLFLCSAAIFIYRQYSQNQSAAPTEPAAAPAVTVVAPTREDRPTNEPRPTDAPPPVEQPTNPPEQPTQPLDDGSQAPGTSPCASVGLIGAPLLVIGANRLGKKRNRKLPQ
jgi:serine/threonine-protein kinase